MTPTDGRDVDGQVRLRAFQFLEAKTRLHGSSLPWKVLSDGFDFDGRRVPLIGPQGIFKPAVLREMPLSIATAPPVPGKAAPYDDQLGPDGLLRYRYRGTDPRHPDNVGLRLAMQRRAPLVYLHGVVKGFYVAEWPVFIAGDAPRSLTFTVAVGKEGPILSGTQDLANLAFDDEGERRYATRVAMVRLHQQSFRRRVLQAYRDRCAVCRLRHTELLQAAHILPDGHPDGRPEVPNGLALCSLHHSAFDCYVMGVTPDLKVEIRLDVLVVVPGRLSRLGRVRGALLADQLRGRLVKTHDGPRALGRLRIQVQDVLHARDELGINRGNAPHLLLPRLEGLLVEPPPDGLARELLMLGETHHFAREELEGPARAPLRGVEHATATSSAPSLASSFRPRPDEGPR